MEVQHASPEERSPRRQHAAYVLKLGETFATAIWIYFRYFLSLTLATIVVAVPVLGADLLSIEKFRDAADPVSAWVDTPESLLSTLGSAVVG